MDKQQAQNIVRETFENPFDKGRFVGFVKNLLNSIEDAPFTYKGNFIPDAYEQYISTLERIGKYTTGGHKIDILVVRLKKKTSIERARTMQRNFIAWYLNGSRGGEMKDAALAAFVSPNEEDWRFSLIKMDYRFEEGKGGKVKIKEEFTPARRWSFLVGENENSHTAQSKLYPIIADDERNPTLAGLEEAFNIEKVTKEFFEKYRDLFLRTKEMLDEVVSGDKKIKAEFENKSVNTVDFAKKLLGQIVFLYFLQKKGWFGVAKNKNWGDGDKQFLRSLFKKAGGENKNYFNNFLEPLFYEALRNDRRHEDHYFSMLDCKIPFLNGGLFDPMNDYDWTGTDLELPNELFSNDIKTKEGDTGTGILDVLDRYNFTVKEDEPLEKEVAVDPEMLGKVFENLLEVKDRKSKGTYYTPREIVHYMCQQSLINYLHATLNDVPVAYEKLGKDQTSMFKDIDNKPQMDLTIEHRPCPVISKEDIETLIKYGEGLIENEVAAEQKKIRITQGLQKSTGITNKLSETIINHASKVDNALKNIKVCDPAIGSGAFPVGMMSEIVKTRNVLSVFLVTPPPSAPPLKIRGGRGSYDSSGCEDGFSRERTLYNFKRECIEHSLYGVDIDPGAVEIAKLRLWLSLVVDEEDIRHIKPLPNLDYKIVCGNSLSGVNTLFHFEALKRLEALKESFFEETTPTKKTDFKKQIDGLISEITHSDKHFDFKVYFSEVFNPSPNSPFAKGGQGGFDIVIANPPYVRHEAIKELKPELKKQFGDFFCGTADIYTYFYHRGLDILKADGHLCFIAPNKFMRAGYGKNTRALLAGNATPKIVIDFADLPIFDATTYPSILLLEKRLPENDDMTATATFSISSQLDRLEETLEEISFPMPVKALRNEGWNLERPDVLALMEKLRKAGTPLGEYVQGKFYRGVLTGLNEAFVIDAITRERLIAEDLKSEELIKPWLRGRDIKKWKAEWAGLHVIFTRRGVDIERYPAIKRHLEQFRKDLEPKKSEKQKHGRKPGSYQWFEIQDNIAYYEEFEGSKIVYPNITKTNIFAFDTTGILTNQKCFIIPTDDLCLLANLNSKLAMQWFMSTLPQLRGGFFEPSAIFMQQFPVAVASDKQKAPIFERVGKILANPDSPDVPRLEHEIDQLVYALYGLTPEEIAIVEGKG